MDEELYTRNTGGPREGMHSSNKAESSGAHSEVKAVRSLRKAEKESRVGKGLA